MPDARGDVLARIRSSIGPDRPSDASAERAALPRNYRRSGGLDPAERIHLLIDRLRDYDSNVVESSASALPQTVGVILRQQNERKVIVAEGVPPELLPADFRFFPERDADLQDLNDCDGIVTLCTVAIASTGSIVLTHGPGEGARRLTLVPDRHLCILRADQIVETVPEAFDRLAPFATHPLTFISGPSATADIEMTRIRGVHGPRFLDVVLVR
jgi:L-lactate dehydrogenase complex protein LldG